MALSADLELWDYRRRLADLYHEVRRHPADENAWLAGRAARDELFRGHSQSPLETRSRPGFAGLRYFTYDPARRIEVAIQPFEREATTIGHSGPGETAFRPFDQAELPIRGTDARLTVYWLEGYGGGVFVPFRDLTNGRDTYGGGRYLLDTAKGADLGTSNGKVVIDFNYAYHPSCVYSDRWSWSLAPAENRLPVAVVAGERL